MADQPQMTIREAFAIRELRRLTGAQLVSVFGDFLALFAVFSIVSFRLHGSPAEVAGISVAYVLPMAFVGPAAGVFADRWAPKATMVASDLTRAILVLFLIFCSSTWQIYGVMIALSAVSSLFTPAQTIAIRSIVPAEGLMSANALMMQVFQITQIVSPGIAGLLIGWLGEKSCFWLDSATFLFSAATVSALAIRKPVAATSKPLATVFADLGEGVRFIFTHGNLAFTIAAMGAGLFAIRCYGALIAVYVRDILNASTVLFGALGSLIGVGMMAGTILVHRFAKRRSKEHMMMSGLFGVAGGILVLAVFSSITVTLIATIAIGVFVALIIIAAQTLMQGQTPVEMLGRVTSSLMSVLSLAQVAGLGVAGGIAQAIGIRNSYYATSALLVCIAAAGWRVVDRRKAAQATA
jgi:MFS family permease